MASLAENHAPMLESKRRKKRPVPPPTTRQKPTSLKAAELCEEVICPLPQKTRRASNAAVPLSQRA
jgi:hypothetical protein